MIPLLQRFLWWVQRHRKEDEVREELQFHLEQEAVERRAAGLSDDEARWAAARDLGNEVTLREDIRGVWTWRPLDELTQDLRYAIRMLVKHRAVTVFATLSLALGIGASTAIYSFMDAILLRSLPVPDAGAMVVMTWRSQPFNSRRSASESEFVLHSIDGSVYTAPGGGREARIFPFAAFERLRDVSAPVLSSVFAFFSAGRMNVMIDGDAELAEAQYVSGDFFRGVAIAPAAGRLLDPGDDRPGASPVAVINAGYAQRRFGAAGNAVGRPIFVNNIPFTVVGVTATGFFGVDPGVAPSIYLPLHANLLLDPEASALYVDQNYYWAGIMGRLQSGVTLAQAQSALSAPFTQWVATTATTERERANLPVLQIVDGAGGLDTLRRKYAKPLYVLLAMVGLILAIACANTANLLLARATARQREIAVRLSLGAGRLRLIRQLLTESFVLAVMSGVIGIAIAVGSTRLLSALLSNGDDGFTLQAALNWNVLAVTGLLSLGCGALFGLVPAIQSTRLALVPALKDATALSSKPTRHRRPRLRLQQGLVVAQITLLMLLLVGAGLFVRTLTNLQSIPLGFNPEDVLLFEVNAPQAGYPEPGVAAFYTDLHRRFAELPGVRATTLAHASLIRAGRGHPVTIDGVPADGTRLLQTGPGFFSAMDIPILQGRAIDDRDRQGSLPVAVISDLFARRFFANQNPLGRRIKIAGSLPMEVDVIGVAATARYGPLKYAVPPVIYVAYSQIPVQQLRQMTFALRTDGDPMRFVPSVRHIVHDADARVPVTNVKTLQADIDQTINQEIILARLGSTFAIVALVIACVGLYGTMAYAVVRRTREIGIRMALGARRGAVVWMVLREIFVLAAIGLAISVPLARVMSGYVESFLFEMTPNDPRAVAVALVTLMAAALAAGYGPARRASRIEPTTALRDE